MKERAYAKINLCLDVLGKREDGYHELKMVMSPIDFYDTVEIRRGEVSSFSCNATTLPLDEQNTVLKAIRVFEEMYHVHGEYIVDLVKHVPAEAGLGGGSADGAATLRILNRMYGLNLPFEELKKCALLVGADVPFCLLNQPAIVTGIGETIEPFEVNCDFQVLLVKPQLGVSTRSAFAKMDELPFTHGDCEGLKQALVNKDYPGVLQGLSNSLEPAAIALNPEIGTILKDLRILGMDGVLMSGSGSCVFGLSQEEELVEKAAKAMMKKGHYIRKTKLYNGKEEKA